ncbi:MAG: BamA/TamA family outer membrane protein [Pseudomonadota bacterium]
MGLSLPAAASAQDLRLSLPNTDLAARLRGEALVFQAEDDATNADLVATARGDYERILAALYDEGYFGATVSIRMNGREAAGLSAFSAPATVTPIEIAVDVGSRFRFGRADISPRAPGSAASEDFRPGAIASTGAIRGAAGRAIDDWRAASHAKARITGQDVTARHTASELDVALTIVPGPALTFGDLVVPADATVRPERIRTIAGLPKGQPFTPAAVDKARARLVSTGTFASVVAREAVNPNTDGSLDIELDLEAAPLRRLGFGAEISSNEGVSLEAFWLHRNIFGGAERLRFDASVSGIGGDSGGIDYALSSLLSIPGFRRADDTLDISIAFERLDEPAFEERLVEIGVRRSRQVNENTEAGVYLGYRGSESTDAFGSREFQHFIISVDASLDLRDDSLNPTSGYFLVAEVQPFIGFSGSETGVILSGDARAYRALGDRTVIAGRFQLGSIQGASVEGTPPDFLFFSGGGGSVRGQGFQSLGVVSNGSTIGGQSFAGASLEVRRDITESIGVVGFLDYGYIAEEGNFENGKDHAGVGIGVRYNTTLGPLRVDVGVPLGDASDPDTSYGLYIGLGQSF